MAGEGELFTDSLIGNSGSDMFYAQLKDLDMTLSKNFFSENLINFSGCDTFLKFGVENSKKFT